MISTTAFAFATPEMAPGTPGEISDHIKMEISSDTRMDGTKVSASLRDGIAILTGHVATLDQAERAAERAMSVVKVRAVVNELEIGGGSIPDESVKTAVRAALDKNKALDAGRITVNVEGGKAVLGGAVGTWDEQEIAREAVSRVPGVKLIENKTEVTFDGIRSDDQIAEQLRQLIANDPLCDGLSLSVSVKEGAVRLKGELGSRGEYDRLVRRSSVTGVFEVNSDRLTINSDLKMEAVEDKDFTPDQMMAALGDAMKADRRIDPGMIRSELAEGVVTLSGQVPADEMKAAAESTARGVPGVMAVSNQIQVGGETQRPLVSVNAPLVTPRR
ncbi:BON domain-containing protein [Luteolibacter sp. SL250]|uniref:BON domain-containing protein n=1 Tax=Luteolibacter sp. SL250 TaxID=2995170 RepID=UPI00226E184C|nr:BON domain-containing protein [Luteolibacter sp. SL250]WAC19360.1 BON domain-containing protein [Luteolibacter sp. SL250]